MAFVILKILQEASYFVHMNKTLLAELNEILLSSILYINCQKIHYRTVGVFAEILSETLVYIFQNIENPFHAFDNYKENYDDILTNETVTGISKKI